MEDILVHAEDRLRLDLVTSSHYDFFFFQAEDGIRDDLVTGVQTCALPISDRSGTFSQEVGLLMTVSDLSVIQVKVQVDETDVVRVHLGDSVEVSIDAFPDTVFAGRVTKISDSAILTAGASVAGSNTQAVDYTVEITLNNPPSDVRPDLSPTARVITDTPRQALALPTIALTVREDNPLA